MLAPRNHSEVRRFLGSVQFCAKFIPQFATISAPLWNFTSKTASWNWAKKERVAFDHIKSLLTSSPVMAYFTQGSSTRLTTDASPVGIGTIFEQQQPDGHFRPLFYASCKNRGDRTAVFTVRERSISREMALSDVQHVSIWNSV